MAPFKVLNTLNVKLGIQYWLEKFGAGGGI